MNASHRRFGMGGQLLKGFLMQKSFVCICTANIWPLIRCYQHKWVSRTAQLPAAAAGVPGTGTGASKQQDADCRGQDMEQSPQPGCIRDHPVLLSLSLLNFSSSLCYLQPCSRCRCSAAHAGWGTDVPCSKSFYPCYDSSSPLSMLCSEHLFHSSSQKIEVLSGKWSQRQK